MSLAPESTLSDLPRRTWRGWWLAWPKWFRIGCWAAIGMVVVHVAVAVRIWIGWMESREVTTLRQHGAQIGYLWDNGDAEPFPHSKELLAGLLGKSRWNVRRISLDHGNDDDLALIGKHCPRLKTLRFRNGEVSAEGLAAISGCRELEDLSLASTNIDDLGIANLKGLHRLRSLSLRSTLATDAAVPDLQSLTSLEWLDLSSTDVGLRTIDAWRVQNDRRPGELLPEEDRHPTEVLCSVRWSDGQRSVSLPEFHWGLEVFAEGPLPSRSGNRFRFGHANLEGRHLILGPSRGMQWSPSDLIGRGDGEYRCFVNLFGEFESEPVNIRLTNGIPSVRTAEFRMPCTKAEALHSIEQYSAAHTRVRSLNGGAWKLTE